MSILLPQLKTLPDQPGVYFFKKGRTILYIGKATSLRDRVRSYFAKDLWKVRSELVAEIMVLADKIDFQATDSVLEALILEAELIRKHKPFHNTEGKDDKSFMFAVITDEDFPQLLTIRGRDLEDAKVRGMKVKHEFGPFSNGPSLREALKIIRKIFPYRDEKCHALSGKPCFNYQLGLCPGTCVGVVTKAEYGRILRNIVLFLRGKKGELLRKLRKDMKQLAKDQKFEEASRVKRQIFALEHIRDVSLIKREEEPSGDGKSFRIEAYDIAHMQGGSMTGVMVVIEDGIAKKADYRMFKIRRKGINDVASLKEILERRKKHAEWPKPDLVVTDGGIPQLNVAKELFEETPIVGVVKNEKHQPERFIGSPTIVKKYQRAILFANAEAHRFTLKYHRKLRSKNMFGL